MLNYQNKSKCKNITQKIYIFSDNTELNKDRSTFKITYV